MLPLCDLQVHVNSQETFFLCQKIVVTYSGRLKKIIKQLKRITRINNSGIHLHDFPGGPYGFELASKFCYNNGTIPITVSNVCLLHCISIFLGMTEKLSVCNLLHQTETFLEGIFDWSWHDILACLQSCQSFFAFADSAGLVDKLVSALLAKIAQNSDINLMTWCSSSSSSSPDTTSSSFNTTPESMNKPCSSSKAWWFDDMAILHPRFIEKFIKTLGAYRTENNSLILTRFLLNYLKTAVQRNSQFPAMDAAANSRSDDYGGLADTAVYGVILVGKAVFSCRGLFWVLRVVSGFGLSKECRVGLERLIGGMLDLATLDDLLVSGLDKSVYDVNLVGRLIRVFVNSNSNRICVEKMKKVGRLIDKYMGQIALDPNLNMSKFIGVAESLPDSSRDCFDEVYRAIDIYLESHPSLSFEERSRLCRCLNYEKLTLEACKDLGKNPRIPPRIAVQALMSKRPAKEYHHLKKNPSESQQMGMQCRMLELDKVSRHIKAQMSSTRKYTALSALCSTSLDL